MRKMLVVVAAASVLVLTFNGTAAADSAYHTERLALSGRFGRARRRDGGQRPRERTERLRA